MSMFRKTVLTTAIIGAGLASTTGAAFAGDSHTQDPSGSCSNVVQGESDNGAGDVVNTIVEGGSQSLGASNTCGNYSGNSVGSDNNVALGGSVQNGNSTEETNVSSTDETTSIVSSILG